MSFPITTIPGDPRDSMHAFRTSSRQTVIGHDWRRRELFKVSRLRCSVTHVRHTCTPFTRRVCWLAREQTCSVSCRYVNSLASLGIANYNATPRRRYAVAQRGDLIPPDSPRTTDPRDSRDPNPAFPRRLAQNSRKCARHDTRISAGRNSRVCQMRFNPERPLSVSREVSSSSHIAHP